MGLAWSFWVNVIVLYVLIGTAAGLSLSLLEEHDLSPLVYIWLAAFLFLLRLGLYPWQLIGAWRAASRHKARTNRKAAAVVTKVVLVPLWLLSALALTVGLFDLWRQGSMVLQVETGPPVKSTIQGNGRELVIEGPIAHGLAARVDQLLMDNPTLEFVTLTSRGGWVDEAHAIRNRIRAHRLNTRVATHCASACALIFIGGHQRILAPDAKLGFHGSSSALSLISGDGFDRRYFSDLGIPNWFIDDAFGTPPYEMWYPQLATLVSAGVVTAVDRDAIDAKNMEQAALRALKAHEPEAYAEYVEAFAVALERGAEASEFSDLGGRHVGQFARQRLPRASNQAAQLFAGYVAATLRHLGVVDPVACYRVVNGGSVETPIGTEVPDELMESGDNAVAAVIKGAAVNETPPPDPERAMAVFLAAVVLQAAERPQDADFLISPEKHEDQKLEVCRAYGQLMQRLADLPPDEGGPAIRFLYTRDDE